MLSNSLNVDVLSNFLPLSKPKQITGILFDNNLIKLSIFWTVLSRRTTSRAAVWHNIKGVSKYTLHLICQKLLLFVILIIIYLPDVGRFL